MASDVIDALGYAGVFDADNEGIDVDYDEQRIAPPDRSRLVVDAELGVGELLIGHATSDFGRYEARFDGGTRYRALETLLADGKVQAIGVSNFMVDHLTTLLAQAAAMRAATSDSEAQPKAS